jgi:hypothetical protein
VAQNARNREMVFDGWEDYNYKTDTCIRCQDDRFLNLGDEGEIVNTVSHTGKHSLFLDNGQSVSTTVPLGTFEQDTVAAQLSIKIDSTPLVSKKVTGNGTGLKMRAGSHCNEWSYPTMSEGTNVDHNWGTGNPPALCNNQKFIVKWNGYIQPRYDGVYTFDVKCDDFVSIWIKRNNVTRRITRIPNNGREIPLGMETGADWSRYFSTDTISLEAGELYEIEVYYEEVKGNAFAHLVWSSKGSQSQPREIVPVSQLYPPSSNIGTVKAATIASDTTWCVKMNGPKPTRVTIDRFSPLAGTKVVVSAWVTQPRECITEKFENADITLSFNDTEETSFFLSPRGPLIDGWQRIEDTLTLPEGATTMTISLNCSGNPGIFFDDIRFHPYNSNMKSFVYDPVNLRLMAELDENNYATFYEYDDDGTLIRVKKETQRGVKTIKETRSALLKDDQ